MDLPAKLCPPSPFGCEVSTRKPKNFYKPQSNPFRAKVWTYLLSAAAPACYINMANIHKSPAKKVRSVQRLLCFIQSKIRTKETTLMIYPQAFVSIEPTVLPKLSVCNLPSVSLPPNPPMNYDQSSQTSQDNNIPRMHPCAPLKPSLFNLFASQYRTYR